MRNPFEEVLQEYRLNWVGFVEDLIKPPDPLEPWQRDLLTDIQNGERFISIRSGHGVRKTSTLSMASLCQHYTRFPARSVVTAPSSHQLFNAYWSELKKWKNHLPPTLSDLFEVQKDRMFLKAAEEDSWLAARTAQPDRPEAIAGVHAPNVLVIADEAPGVIDPALEALIGSLTDEHATMVMAGNPTRSSGLFYRSHHDLAVDWKTYHISCVDSAAVSPTWIDLQRRLFGENSNTFRVRVLGEFPLSDDDAVLPAFLVYAARDRDIERPTRGEILWALDVARFGSNASVLIERRGPWMGEPTRWRGMNTMELVGRVRSRWKHTQHHERPGYIYVDDIGVGGGVVDRLQEVGLPAVRVNVSELPAQTETFANLRTEIAWAMRTWLEPRDVSLPGDKDLLQELLSIRYTYTSAGKIILRPKSELTISPDSADAAFLTFAGPAARSLYGARYSTDRQQPLRRGISTL